MMTCSVILIIIVILVVQKKNEWVNTFYCLDCLARPTNSWLWNNCLRPKKGLPGNKSICWDSKLSLRNKVFFQICFAEKIVFSLAGAFGSQWIFLLLGEHIFAVVENKNFEAKLVGLDISSSKDKKRPSMKSYSTI